MKAIEVLDSRTIVAGSEERLYGGSESPSRDWGQPPASYYYLDVIGGTLYGQPTFEAFFAYMADDLVVVLDSELKAEFEAWEAASDEALTLFEEGLG